MTEDNTLVVRVEKKRGFAAMNAERQKEIASKGGKAAHQKGTAHKFTSEEARVAGKKGGHARSQKSQEHCSQPETASLCSGLG